MSISGHGIQIIGAMKCYPDDGDGVTVASPATDWGTGADTELIASDTITKPFVLTGVSIAEGGNQNVGEHQLDIKYTTESVTVVIASVRFVVSARQTDFYRPLSSGAAYMVPIPANSQIEGKLAYAEGSSVAISDAIVTLHYVEIG